MSSSPGYADEKLLLAVQTSQYAAGTAKVAGQELLVNLKCEVYKHNNHVGF